MALITLIMANRYQHNISPQFRLPSSTQEKSDNLLTALTIKIHHK